MEIEDIIEGSIVYLRFMKFPDSNTLDYRLNGRPYLVYKIIGDKAYLFSMTSNVYNCKEYYYETFRTTVKGKKRQTYVNLKNYIEMSLTDLVNKTNELIGERKHTTCKVEYYNKKELDKIAEQISLLCLANEYRKKMKKIVECIRVN